MRIPPKTSNRYKILQTIYIHGPMSVEQGLSLVGGLDHVKVSSAFAGCTGLGLLIRDHLTYKLSNFAKKYFDDISTDPNVYKPEIVPPRDASLNNKPWSGKYSFDNYPRRVDLREVSFKTASNAVVTVMGA